ncbi:MAG: nodulation protein NfeD, partial [Thermoprotei archaeon]
EEFLSVISDPSIAILLIITGLVLIGFELIVTGFQGWGIIGTILAILGLYGLGLIGTSLLILTLTAAGIAFLIAELAQPGLQIFGGTGLVLLLIAMALAYRNEPYVSATHMMAIAIALLALTFGVLTFLSIKIRSALRRKPKTIEDLVGKIGIARTRIGEVEKGVVYLEGEEWSAVSVRGWIEAGSKVKVVKVEGLTLVVEKEDKS